MQHFDFIVNGGGMVGASVALGLADLGFEIALIEYAPPAAMPAADATFELRVSALAPASIALLESLGVWSVIQAERVCPYRRMRVFDQNSSGDVTFDAAEIGAPYLGYIVENKRVQAALWQRIDQHEQIQAFTEVQPAQVQMSEQQVQLLLDDGQMLRARWLLGADGARSWVRETLGLGARTLDYGVYAQVLSVQTAYPQQDITWQRFTSHGPEAFLPLAGQRASLVWYDSPDAVQQRAKQDSASLLDALHTTFPAELGEISHIEQQGYFPIRKMHAQRYHHQRAVLLGDAAHAIHPLAGQGANLGFADVQAWLQLMQEAKLQRARWAALANANAYARARRLDNQMMQSAMDAFEVGFKQNQSLIRHARGAGMQLVAQNRWLRAQITRLAGGQR